MTIEAWSPPAKDWVRRSLLHRQTMAALAGLAGLAWALATVPWVPLLAALGGVASLMVLLRRPWLIWPVIGAVLPVSSGLKQGPVSVTDLLLAAAIALWFVDGARRGSLRLAPSPWLGWLALYIGALYLSMLQAADLGEAAVEVIKWTQLALVVVLVQAMMPPAHRQWLVAALLVAGMGQALLGLYQFVYRIGPDWFIVLGRFMRASGSFAQPNPFGGYLGLTLPVAVSLALWAWRDLVRRPWVGPGALLWAGFYTVAALLMGAGLIASWSRGAWVGATVAIPVVLFVRSRRAAVLGLALLLFAIGATLVGAFSPRLLPSALTERVRDLPTFLGLTDVLSQPVTDENFAVVERVAHWVAALRMWEMAPWLGVGPGNYSVVYPQVRLPLWEEPLGHAHNIYLHVLGENGLIGLAAFLALWVAAFGWALARWGHAAQHGQTWSAALALGVVGVLTHLTVHNLFDNLFVQGMHLQIALWLAILHLPRCQSAPIWSTEEG